MRQNVDIHAPHCDDMTRFLKAPAMRWLLPIALLITAAVYWPGLSGSWLFDDYPNIVDNPGVQPHEVNVPALVRAALSSPASDFKRPLASLSFATNYLASGLNPWSWKLFNLVVHLLDGVLVFLLARMLLLASPSPSCSPANEGERRRSDIVAALIAAAWMLLPINLTAVLYVVQREESMANLFVLLGLAGYVAARRSMLRSRVGCGWRGLALCAASLILATLIGLLAKETAAMLPLYAFLVEWILFHFDRALRSVGAHPVRDNASGGDLAAHGARSRKDWRIAGLFVAVLVLPLLAGLTWLLPNVLNAASWATRDFTLGTRLLSETRIVCDYIGWTLLPTPQALSFYHDQFHISTGLLSPWATLFSLLGISILVMLVFLLRRRKPLAALGISLYLGCHVMTGTIIPLELVYEHRNYFASFGVLLAVVPRLAAVPSEAVQLSMRRPRWLLLRRTLLVCLLLWWTGLTTVTAYAWGDPLRLAQDLATRAPDSPRAQYELGRTYIVYSHYDPASPYTRLAYAPLERAANFPESSILPQQALIFMNSRMGLPLKPQWWDSMIAKLKARKPGVQDESSLAALAQCARDGACPLPTDHMAQAFEAALDHPKPSARLQATYSDYAWNVLNDHALGLRMIKSAVATAPGEPAYRTTLVRMLVAQGQYPEARRQIQALQTLNIGRRLDRDIIELQAQLPAKPTE